MYFYTFDKTIKTFIKFVTKIRVTDAATFQFLLVLKRCAVRLIGRHPRALRAIYLSEPPATQERVDISRLKIYCGVRLSTHLLLPEPLESYEELVSIGIYHHSLLQAIRYFYIFRTLYSFIICLL